MGQIGCFSLRNRTLSWGVLAACFALARPGLAATSATVVPITWNVVGLDSNNPSTGPNQFPVGVRVTNTGAAANVTVRFVWDSANSYIALSSRTSSTLPSSGTINLATNGSADFYFEVEIQRNTAAYGTARRYHIEASTDGGASWVSSPTVREIYVERLVSQNRNSVNGLSYKIASDSAYTSVPAGGSMTLRVGTDYDIKLDCSTATSGYEQVEAFLNLANTTFRVLSTTTTYSATSVGSPYDRIYADGCGWENNPFSPNYRSCTASGKNGGTMTVTYRVSVLAVPSTNPSTVQSALYDFSGSSFHYNADSGVSTRYATILSPASVGISKAFVPSTIVSGSTSTLTIRITNPSPSDLAGVNFTDTLPTTPGAMTVASTPSATTTGCGSPTFAPASGNTSLSFSGATIPANSTCVVQVNVTASTTGSYTNTTGTLYINGTTPGTGTSTGNTASASLSVVGSVVNCTNQTIAKWTIPVGATNPPDTTGGVPSTKAGNVPTATASATVPGSTSILATGFTTSAWRTFGYKTTGQTLRFAVDARNYTGVQMTWYWNNSGPGNGPTTGTISSSAGGSAVLTPPAASGWVAGPTITTLSTSSTGSTTFSLAFTGAGNDNSNGALDFDDITFTGCYYYPPPTLSKSFGTSPIIVNGTPSQLTFNVGNANTGTGYPAVALTGVSFSDSLPSGLQVVNNVTYPTSNTCGGTLTAADASSSISLSGVSLAASATCQVKVYVKGTAAGTFQNVSGYVTATESGANSGSNGYGSASITVVAPPVISKSFAAAQIYTDGTTSLSFTVRNPNVGTTLNGVSFTDSLPSGLVVATPNGLSGSCGGGTITATAGSSSVALASASLAALGTCTFSVTVLGSTPGDKANSVTVGSTEGGTGNTATANVVVKTPTPAIRLLKQVSTSALGPWVSSLGTTASSVYYRFTLENVGDVPLVGPTLTDPTVSVSGCKWVTTLPTADVGNNQTGFCVVGPIATQASATVTNTATASASYAGTEVTSTSSATYSTKTELRVTKVATESSFAAAGDTLHYSYGVTNTGGVAFAGPVTVSDNKIASVSCPSDPTSLAVGATIVCTGSYTVLAADATAGFVTNTASATSNGTTSATTSKTVPRSGGSVTDFAVTMTNSGRTVTAGGTTTFTIVVTNNGPTAGNVTVQYPAVAGLTKTSIGTCTAYGGATCPTITTSNLESGVTVTSLPAGGSISFTVTASVTSSSPPSSYVSTVTATASGMTDYDTSNNTASVTNVLAQNFGHLPSSYTGLNLLPTGARHLTGTAYLGATVTTADDGINTETYTTKASDDGVTWTPGVSWSVASGGSVDVTVVCPSGGCYLNAWFDWNANSSFADTGDWTIQDRAVSAGKNTITFPIPAGAKLDGTVIYSRFRLYSALPTSPQPGGQALGSGSVALAGEIEDPFFKISGGVVTPVTLSSFSSERRGGRVFFAWSTATETANVGFNLYAVKDATETRINPELIASTRPDSLERQDYTYAADTDANLFLFEDVGILGDVRLHGPFPLGQAFGEPVEVQKVDHAAIRQSHATAIATAAALRAGAASRSNTVDAKVPRTGIQRISYEALRDAGLDLAGFPAARIRLTNGGQGVPIRVGGPATFGPGSYVEYYGEALDTIYTGTNVYTVQLAGRGVERLHDANGQPAAGVAPAASYPATVTVNNQRAFANYAPGSDAWYDTSMLAYKEPKSWDFPIEVTAVANPAAAATLEVVLWGVTGFPESPDHHVVVRLNGAVVADRTFDGLTEHVVRVPVPAGVLREGANVLQLTLPGDTGVAYDMVNLDRYSVSYERRFKAENGRLAFTAKAGAFEVTNLPSGQVTVYRRDDDGIVRLGGVEIRQLGSTWTATFAGSDRDSSYVVAAGEGILQPALEPTRVPANVDVRADYLVIAHPDFIPGLQPLVQARQAEGHTVNVVDVRDLYARYTHGIFDPSAIRAHIAYAEGRLGARQVLLVGGDTYDYRNYTALNNISFVPSLYVATSPSVRFVPADPLFADVDGDGIPDLAIGRLPVRSTAELDLAIRKTLAYSRKDYARTALFASDRYDGYVSFKGVASSLSSTLPPGWSVSSTSLDDLSVEAARDGLVAGMNRGTALVTFTGHSGPAVWTFDNLFSTKHASALTNAGLPFVVVQWGCWNTYAVDPANNYLVQAFLFSGDRGAAAVLGATTLSQEESERKLGTLLTPRMTTRGVSIGQALQDAKRELARTDPGLLDVLIGWTLMGDPALVIEP